MAEQTTANPEPAIGAEFELSRELKSELTATLAAYASGNLEEIYRRIGGQAVLCLQLQHCGENTTPGQDVLKTLADVRARRTGVL
jgi:hypothetical protein